LRTPAPGDFCLMPDEELLESCEMIAALRLSAERTRGEAIALKRYVEESREYLRRLREKPLGRLLVKSRNPPKRKLRGFD
jgi:hypothetical protein